MFIHQEYDQCSSSSVVQAGKLRNEMQDGSLQRPTKIQLDKSKHTDKRLEGVTWGMNAPKQTSN